MKVWQAIVLGLTQGLTEFLPISSSGHLFLLTTFFGLDLDFLLLAAVLHCGTLVAVFIVFFKDILFLFRPSFRRLGILAAATVPAAVLGFLFGGRLNEVLNGITLGLAFLLTAVLLLLSEHFGKKFDGNRPIGLSTGLVMGGMQCLALFPGVSRSGSTVAGGLFCRAERQDVASFSFLMSIPVIAGATLMQIAQPAAWQGIGFFPLAAGFFASLAAGLFAAKLFLKAVNKLNLKWFALYLLLLAALTFIFI